MNVIPSLGITVLHRNGEPILPNATPEPTPKSRVAQVSLVESVVIPGQKRHYLKAHDGTIANDLLLGVCARESLIHKQELDDGTIIVPVHHYQDIAVHMEAEALLEEARQFDAEHNVLALHEAEHWSPLANDASV